MWRAFAVLFLVTVSGCTGELVAIPPVWAPSGGLLPPEAPPAPPFGQTPDAGTPQSDAGEPAPPPDGGSPEHLRIVTWNVRYGTDRWEQPAVPAQIAEMANWDADVILLQEASPYEDAYLAGLQAHSSAWVRPPGPQMMVTRLPVVGSESRNIGPNSWGPDGRWALRVDVAVGAKVAHVFNTHLDISPGICSDFQNHIANRNAFIAFTQETSGPIVAGGDLNVWSWAPPGCDYQRDTLNALWAHYRDACEDLGGTETSCNDYVTFHNQSDTRWRPDHLFRNSEARYLSYEVKDVARSDHKPVIVDVELP